MGVYLAGLYRSGVIFALKFELLVILRYQGFQQFLNLFDLKRFCQSQNSGLEPPQNNNSTIFLRASALFSKIYVFQSQISGFKSIYQAKTSSDRKKLR
jgi:hypothetical protein